MMRRLLIVLIAVCPAGLLLSAGAAQANSGSIMCSGQAGGPDAVDCSGANYGSGLVLDAWFNGSWGLDNAYCCAYAGSLYTPAGEVQHVYSTCTTITHSGGRDIYIVGMDGNIWNSAWYRGSGWTPWVNQIGNPGTSARAGEGLTCNYDGSGNESLHMTDLNGYVWSRYWNIYGQLSPWQLGNPPM